MTVHTQVLGRNRDRAIRLVQAAPDGSVMRVSPKTRTLDQNAKMQAMLTDISVSKPQGRSLPPHVWKCLLMDDIGHKPRWEPSLDGDGVVNTGYRSSRMTVAEMSDMIERMYAFGTEHEIVWSEPARAEGIANKGTQHDR